MFYAGAGISLIRLVFDRFSALLFAYLLGRSRRNCVMQLRRSFPSVSVSVEPLNGQGCGHIVRAASSPTDTIGSSVSSGKSMPVIGF